MGKENFLLGMFFGVLILMFLAGGVFAANETCVKQNDSCCKSGNCIKIFADGLPSVCSDGNLPIFSGCDADCKVISICNSSQGQGVDINYPQDVLCTPDKKQCSDGSYVERAGFDCEFAPCSEVKMNFFERIINWFKNIFS